LRCEDAFAVSAAADAFRRRCYPDSTLDDWNDWQWQARHRIRSLADIRRILSLSNDEHAAILSHGGSLPLGITP
jgi:lysine 2,3-aminomutase